VTAYNFAKHLKALRWKTPFEAICAAWTEDPEAFIINPRHLIPGPNNIPDAALALQIVPSFSIGCGSTAVRSKLEVQKRTEVA
jgi:hypothetical protein